MGSVKRLEAMLILWKNGVDGRIERLSQMELNQGQRAHPPYSVLPFKKRELAAMVEADPFHGTLLPFDNDNSLSKDRKNVFPMT